MATFQHAGITTTTVTANQVISSFTPTNATSWKCTSLVAYLTAYSGTESNLGTAKLQSGGTDIFETRIQNTDLDTGFYDVHEVERQFLRAGLIRWAGLLCFRGVCRRLS